MQLKKTVFVVLLGLLLSACAAKEYKKQESVFIVFKTPTFRHADLGFIYQNDKELKVEIYSSGQPIMSLEISEDLVCMGTIKCMSKNAFNERIMSKNYPASILDNIFKGQKIFASQNLITTGKGFSQNIMKAGKYDIEYSVLSKQIVFRDRINSILIKVKRL